MPSKRSDTGTRDFQALTGLPPARLAPTPDGPALARSLFWVATVRVVLVTAALAIAFWQFRSSPFKNVEEVAYWQYLVIAAAYGFGLLGILALRQGRALRPVAFAQTVADAGIVTTVVLMTGGAESVFAFTYVFVVLEGSVVLLRAGAMVAMAVSTLLFGTVLLLQLGQTLPDLLPPVVASNAIFAFFVHSTGVGLVAILASNLATKLRIAGRQLAEREEDLERLGELHAGILRALPAGLLTVGPDGIIRFGNESAHAILHLPPRALVGASLCEVLPEVGAVHQAYDVEQRGDGQVGRMGRTRRHEASVDLSDGAVIRVGFSFAPLSMPEGASTIVVFQDVTEVVRLEAAVERAERLALVGKFAAGLAHEVRNPLASMCASIDVLEASLDPPEGMRRLMENVVREAARLDNLIRDFLALARPRKLSFAKVDLGALVAGVLEVFENDRLMQGIEVALCVEGPVFATGDQDLLRQVLWNLVRNAAEAMQGASNGATLRIEVSTTSEGPTVAVIDTGPGLGEEELRRAFDPFYSTKREGSGLGLAISQSIVQAHGGELELTSRPGSGARVVIHLRESVPTLDVPLDDPSGMPVASAGGF